MPAVQAIKLLEEMGEDAAQQRIERNSSIISGHYDRRHACDRTR
jgi:hypothetical protein